jgi:hypothetical protein
MWSVFLYRGVIENINTSHPRVSQTSSTSDIDTRDAPANAVGPLFGDRTDGLVTVALSATTDIALPVNLHSGICVAAFGTVHCQPIESTGLPPHV